MAENSNFDKFAKFSMYCTKHLDEIKSNLLQENKDGVYVNQKDQDNSIFVFNNDNFGAKFSNDSNIVFDELSAVDPNILGPIVDTFDGENKDGAIGETKQHSTGNCWLLSGINALSYTEKGRQIIKDCLEYCGDVTKVHLKGFGTIEVSDIDVAYTKGSSQYSSGDDDMIIFELAIEQVLDQIARGDIMVDPDASWYMEDSTELEVTKRNSSSATGGYVSELIYFVTGKEGKRIDDKEEMKESLVAFEKNDNKDIAMGASTNKEAKVKDIDGKTVKLPGNHAYSIKEVKDGIVTVINPWDSSKEIKLDTDTFCEAFNSIDMVDLSNKNPVVSNISKNCIIDEDGNKRFVFFNPYKEVQETRDSKTGKTTQRDVYDINGKKTKQENWEYNNKGEKTSYLKSEYSDEKLKYTCKYSYNPKTDKGTTAIGTYYDKDEKKTEVFKYGYVENGEWDIQTKEYYDAETGEQIKNVYYHYNEDGSYEANTYDCKTRKKTKSEKYDSNGDKTEEIIYFYDSETGEYKGSATVYY